MLFRRVNPFTTKLGYYIWTSQQVISYWEIWVEGIVFNSCKDFPAHGTFIDIGASYGIVGFIARKLWPHATIIGFEPQPSLANCCRSLAVYSQFHECALCGLALGRTILKSARTEDGFLASGSTESNDKFWNDGEKIAVDGRELDSFHIVPDFVKIDVDGAEPGVVFGGLKTLRGCKVLCECLGTEKEIANLLKCNPVKQSQVDYLFQPQL